MRKTKKAVKAAPKKVQRGGKKSNAFIAKVLADYVAGMPPEKICKKHKISERTLLRYTLRSTSFSEQLDKYTIESSQRQGFDPVNKPAQYCSSKIEVIDFIEDKGFGYHLGNAV